MKTRLSLLSFAILALLSFPMIAPVWGTVLTFDDVSETGSGTYIANGYHGFNWGNFGRLNAVRSITDLPFLGTSGVYYGMVSVSNIALNANGDPADIASTGTNFNFLSAYLTGALNSNLSIQVQGFSGGNLLYDQTVVASATNPTLFTFNYLNIDRLHFNSFGGEPAFPAGPGEHFVMDNMSFEFVPEPSTVLLAALGALALATLLKRRRT